MEFWVPANCNFMRQRKKKLLIHYVVTPKDHMQDKLLMTQGWTTSFAEILHCWYWIEAWINWSFHNKGNGKWLYVSQAWQLWCPFNLNFEIWEELVASFKMWRCLLMQNLFLLNHLEKKVEFWVPNFNFMHQRKKNLSISNAVTLKGHIGQTFNDSRLDDKVLRNNWYFVDIV